jgi:hypothetical protein
MNKSLAEVTKLIDCLDLLHGGDQAVDLLVACGERAVSPLREYLMEGKPTHIYQPRQKAVNALARLGAKEVLIEYLCAPKDIPDPVFRFGEEAVENTAARALARWKTNDVFDVLLRIAYTRTLPGVIEAIGSFRRPEPIPLFIAALMDDVSRPAAENALKSMGAIAKPALIDAACAHNSSENSESPSVLLRRRSSFRILSEMAVTVEEWSRLKKFLNDDDQEIAILAAGIALKIVDSEDKNAAIEKIIGKIPYAGWNVQMEIEKCLVKNYSIAQRSIEKHIEKHRVQPAKAQVKNLTLQILLNIQRRAGAK